MFIQCLAVRWLVTIGYLASGVVSCESEQKKEKVNSVVLFCHQQILSLADLLDHPTNH